MDASLAGLSTTEALERQAQVGRNEIETRDTHTLLQTLRGVASGMTVMKHRPASPPRTA
jgi:hypothetical protein